jgi:hypothetical protein
MFLGFAHCVMFLKKQNVSETASVGGGQSPKT